jgi:hypothetical protein
MNRHAEPVTILFHNRDGSLGVIPGPLQLDAFEDTIWVAGGAWGTSTVLRRAAGKWARCSDSGANGLRSVLALGHESALVAGEWGFLARTDDGGRGFQRIKTGAKRCLYSLSRSSDGTIWAGGDPGGLLRSDDKGWTFTPVADAPPGRNFRVVPGEVDFLINEHCLATIVNGKIKTVFGAPGVLNDVARREDGRTLLVADDGKAWLAADGKRFAPIDVGTRASIGRARLLDGRFVLLCDDGSIRSSADGLTWSPKDVTFIESGLRLISLLPYEGGWLVGGWRRIGPPYEFFGVLAYLGSKEHVPL